MLITDRRLNTEELKTDLLASLLRFTQYFYELRTGRPFEMSFPVSRESHYIQICRALAKVAKGETTQLNINVPPRYGKSELLIHFIAWTMARYPDSNYLYICYSYDLAVKQTQTIREIMSMPSYRAIFGVEMSGVVYSKGNFETSDGGCVYAAGTGGTITGRGAGVKYTTDRFTGAMVFDDLIKPDEASSDVVREGSIDWYYNTALSRRNNGDRTPTINIGQRVHEADLTAHLMKEDSWHSLVIPALDNYNNALDPRIHTPEQLLKMQEQEPYTFAAQYQQNPQPSGGGIFKPDWFPLLEMEPNILASFITIDTAETSKTYNDATVFSLWGLYKPISIGNVTDMVALHWMECVQIRVEPKDLESEFIAFYNRCLQYNVKPSAVAIEKKSTGTTLLSLLGKYHGIQVIDIQCNATTSDGRSNSKTARFLATQPYLAKHLVSLPRYGTHTNMCLDHVRKITANNTHRFDDVADTLAYAVDIELSRSLISNLYVKPSEARHSAVAKDIMRQSSLVSQAKNKAFGGG